MSTLNVKIRVRSDSSANWKSKNPVLLMDELAYDKTEKKFKVGDGLSRWNALDYKDLKLGNTATDAFWGDKGQIAYDHSQATHAPDNAEENQNALTAIANENGTVSIPASGKSSTLHVKATGSTTVDFGRAGDGNPLLTINTSAGTSYEDATESASGLMPASDKKKLNGIEAGAQVNQKAFSTITNSTGTETASSTSSTDTIKFKGAGASTVSVGLDGGKPMVTVTSKDTTYSNATTSAAGLMSNTDKTKLDGVATGAQVNQNAFSTVSDGTTTSSATTATDTVKFKGTGASTVSVGLDNGKPVVTVNSTNTTYSNATSSNSGLMSGIDKTKLDGIASGAQVNSITGVKGSSESTYRTGNVNITKDNIGLSNVDNISDINKVVKSAGELTNYVKIDGINTKLNAPVTRYTVCESQESTENKMTKNYWGWWNEEDDFFFFVKFEYAITGAFTLAINSGNLTQYRVYSATGSPSFKAPAGFIGIMKFNKSNSSIYMLNYKEISLNGTMVYDYYTSMFTSYSSASTSGKYAVISRSISYNEIFYVSLSNTNTSSTPYLYDSDKSTNIGYFYSSDGVIRFTNLKANRIYICCKTAAAVIRVLNDVDIDVVNDLQTTTTSLDTRTTSLETFQTSVTNVLNGLYSRTVATGTGYSYNCIRIGGMQFVYGTAILPMINANVCSLSISLNSGEKFADKNYAVNVTPDPMGHNGTAVYQSGKGSPSTVSSFACAVHRGPGGMVSGYSVRVYFTVVGAYNLTYSAKI